MKALNRIFRLAAIILYLGIIVIVLSHTKTRNKTIPAKSESEGLENPQDRMSWEFNRLKDPLTNKIPAGIFVRELEFASTLPTDKYDLKRDAVWTNRGPWHVGGRTRALAIDLSNENTIIAGAVSGGIWRSKDGGNSWLKVTPKNALQSVSCIVQDTRPGKTNIWYYGTGELWGNSASASKAFYMGNGIYKSIDSGMTWQSLTSTASNTPNNFDIWDGVWNVQLDASKDTQDVVYAATYGTIFRSADGGANWKAFLGGIQPYSYCTDVAVTSKGVVYATLSSDGYQKGIWRSSDGIKWTNITSNNFPPTYDRIVIGIDPNNENKVYFLAHTTGYGKYSVNYLGEKDWNSLWQYVYYSGDSTSINGSWQNLSNSIPAKGSRSFDDFSVQGSYDMVVKVKPGDSNTVFIGGTNLYRSTDAFSTSNHITQIGGYEPGTKLPNWHVYQNHHPDQHVIQFFRSNPNVMLSGTDGGVFRTDDCMATNVAWQILNNGYITTQAYTVNVDGNTNNNIVVSGFQDNGNYFTNSQDPQASWVMSLNGDGSFSAISHDGSFYILSKQLGRIYKMTLDNNGNNTAFARIDPIGGWDYQFINPFVLDPNDDNILYLAEGQKVWRNNQVRSIPLLGNYDSISYGWVKFTDTIKKIRSITALAISKTPANRLYIGTSYQDVYRIDNANTGNPPLTKLPGTSLPAANISCIAVDPRNADKLLLVFSNYNAYSLYYSTDGGYSWQKTAGNLEQNPDGSGDGPSLRWAVIMPVAGKTLYFVGTSVGLFATDSLMGLNTTWEQIGANTIGSAIVDMIVTRESDGLIAIATHGNGIYTTHISSVDDILGTGPESLYYPASVKIYPNPAKDFTFLKIKNPDNGTVSLNIFDQDGKLCKRLNLTPDKNKDLLYKLDLKDYKTGIYNLIITIKNQKLLSKLLIEK